MEPWGSKVSLRTSGFNTWLNPVKASTQTYLTFFAIHFTAFRRCCAILQIEGKTLHLQKGYDSLYCGGRDRSLNISKLCLPTLCKTLAVWHRGFLVLRWPQTSFACKFSCLLNLPPTNLKWSVSFLGLFLPSGYKCHFTDAKQSRVENWVENLMICSPFQKHSYLAFLLVIYLHAVVQWPTVLFYRLNNRTIQNMGQFLSY